MADDSLQHYPLGVEHFSDFDGVSVSREEWDAFVEANGADVFLTFDCCRTWWKYYGDGRSLQILILRDADGIAAILPLFSESIRSIFWKTTLIKLVGADHSILQFSLPVRKERCGAIVQAAVSYLDENVRFDAIALGPLSGLCDGEAPIRDACSRLGFHVEAAVYCPQTYFFPTEGDAEGHVSCLSKKERRNLRRTYKYMEGISPRGIVAERVNGDNLGALFDEFVAFHQDFWRCRGRLGHFGDWSKSAEFHRELAQQALENGRLRLCKLKVGDEIVGYDYGYRFGDVYYDFLNARSDSDVFRGHSLGKIVMCEALTEAARDGVDTVDSMRGLYPYKLKLGGVMKDSKVLHVCRKNLVSRVKYGTMRLWARLVDVLYYRLWFTRLAPALREPEKRKSLRLFWVRTNMLR